ARISRRDDCEHDHVNGSAQAERSRRSCGASVARDAVAIVLCVGSSIEEAELIQETASRCSGACPTQASSRFHLWVWPHAAQVSGMATGGRLSSTTHSALSPVGTGLRVRGHLTRISRITELLE